MRAAFECMSAVVAFACETSFYERILLLCGYGLRGCMELSSSVVHSEAQGVVRAAARIGPKYPRFPVNA